MAKPLIEFLPPGIPLPKAPSLRKSRPTPRVVATPEPANPELPVLDVGSRWQRDFIDDYAEYADVFEAPRDAHEWNACLLIAATLNGKVFIPWGAVKYPLDLWLLLLSGSGMGRNTVTDVAINVVEKAGIQGLLQKSAWGSKQALYQRIAESPHGLYDWPEFSTVMRVLNDPKFGGAKEWFTDRYDNLRVPPRFDYRDTGKNADTPSIEFSEAPRLNILATSSMDWFIENLQQPDTMGGFIPRWLLVRLNGTRRLLPKTMPLDQSKVAGLATRLKAISTLNGNADMSGVEEIYGRWYCDAHARFENQPNKALAVPFFNRLRGQVLKLAVIFEVSQSCTLVVSARAMERAIKAAESIERMIFEILPTGMTREGSEIEKMERYIKDAGPQGVNQSEVTKAFKHWDSKKRDERLKTLKSTGDVVPFLRNTTGRPATVLAHASLVDEHQRGFPQDKRL
jgi:hypothetical protein